MHRGLESCHWESFRYHDHVGKGKAFGGSQRNSNPVAGKRLEPSYGRARGQPTATKRQAHGTSASNNARPCLCRLCWTGDHSYLRVDSDPSAVVVCIAALSHSPPYLVRYPLLQIPTPSPYAGTDWSVIGKFGHKQAVLANETESLRVFRSSSLALADWLGSLSTQWKSSAATGQGCGRSLLLFGATTSYRPATPPKALPNRTWCRMLSHLSTWIGHEVLPPYRGSGRCRAWPMLSGALSFAACLPASRAVLWLQG